MLNRLYYHNNINTLCAQNLKVEWDPSSNISLPQLSVGARSKIEIESRP